MSMTTETTTPQDEFIELKTPEKTSISLLKTALWLVTLILLPQIILGLGFGVFFGIQQGDNYSTETFNSWFMTIPVLLTMSLISPIILIPLLMAAISTNGTEKSWNNLLAFCAVKAINFKALVKYVGLGLVFWLISSVIGELISLPIEQFMIDIKMANDSLLTFILIITTICIVVPITEELTFRGWLYSKIKLTKLGDAGALILTAIIFTLIHTQYNNPVTLVFIFSLGLFLGFVRYKTNNINYAIAIHMLFNSLAMGALFLFEL